MSYSGGSIEMSPVYYESGNPSYSEESSFFRKTDPLNESNYSSNTRTLYIWIIILTIIIFFVTLAINTFFVYLPIARMETKFDETVQKLDDVAAVAKVAAEKTEKVISDVEELGKVAVQEFDKIKAGICTWLRTEGISFPFCSDTGVSRIMSTRR